MNDKVNEIALLYKNLIPYLINPADQKMFEISEICSIM